MAFSAGFSPHPKISYLGAAPTGAASEAEYLEIGLSHPVRPRRRPGRPGRRAARRTSPSSTAWRRGRGPARWPTGSTPRSGAWSCPGSTWPSWRRRSRRSWPRDVVTVAKRTKNGLQGHRRARRRSPARRRPTRQVVPYCTWSSGRERPPYDRTTCWPPWLPSPTCARRCPPGPCVRRRAGSTTPGPWPIRSGLTVWRAPAARGRTQRSDRRSPEASRRRAARLPDVPHPLRASRPGRRRPPRDRRPAPPAPRRPAPSPTGCGTTSIRLPAAATAAREPAHQTFAGRATTAVPRAPARPAQPVLLRGRQSSDRRPGALRRRALVADDNDTRHRHPARPTGPGHRPGRTPRPSDPGHAATARPRSRPRPRPPGRRPSAEEGARRGRGAGASAEPDAERRTPSRARARAGRRAELRALRRRPVQLARSRPRSSPAPGAVPRGRPSPPTPARRRRAGPGARRPPRRSSASCAPSETDAAAGAPPPRPSPAPRPRRADDETAEAEAGAGRGRRRRPEPRRRPQPLAAAAGRGARSPTRPRGRPRRRRRRRRGRRRRHRRRDRRGRRGVGSRRRRRGRRGRGRGRTGEDDADGDDESSDEPAETETDDEDTEDSGDDEGDDEASPASSTRRRRRRRRRGGSAGGEAPEDADDDDRPERAGRNGRTTSDDDVRGVAGSTRLEAKRQRRRDGRDTGRRRAPILTESEFLARREAVDRTMVIRQRGERTQIAVLEDDVLVEHYVTQAQSHVLRRQRLPRPRAERAAQHGGGLRRRRQGTQRRPLRR